MSKIKERIEALCQIQEIMENEHITLEDIREQWTYIKEYRNTYKEE